MADPTRTARASPSNGKARGKVPGRAAGVRASSGSASRLLLAGDRWLRHRHGIGRRNGVFVRLLQGSFLLAFLGAIARLALLFTVGRGRLGWHGFTSTSRPARAPESAGAMPSDRGESCRCTEARPARLRTTRRAPAFRRPRGYFPDALSRSIEHFHHGARARVDDQHLIGDEGVLVICGLGHELDDRLWQRLELDRRRDLRADRRAEADRRRILFGLPVADALIDRLALGLA